jgi:hypothetical protein
MPVIEKVGMMPEVLLLILIAGFDCSCLKLAKSTGHIENSLLSSASDNVAKIKSIFVVGIIKH